MTRPHRQVVLGPLSCNISLLVMFGHVTCSYGVLGQACGCVCTIQLFGHLASQSCMQKTTQAYVGVANQRNVGACRGGSGVLMFWRLLGPGCLPPSTLPPLSSPAILHSSPLQMYAPQCVVLTPLALCTCAYLQRLVLGTTPPGYPPPPHKPSRSLLATSLSTCAR